MIWQPHWTCSMTCSFNPQTCCRNLMTTEASSPFSPLSCLTLSSSLAIRSNFRLLHLEAAILFLCLFRSNLILSWSSMSMGDMGGELLNEAPHVWGSSFTGICKLKITKEFRICQNFTMNGHAKQLNSFTIPSCWLSKNAEQTHFLTKLISDSRKSIFKK